MPTRKQLITQVWIYRKRRDEIKKRYKHGERGAIVGGLTIKIKTWLCQIRRIDARNKKLSHIINSVNTYFNVDISSRCMNKKHQLARNVYYKYSVEQRLGLSGRLLAEQIGRKDPHLVTTARREFTRTFKTNLTNRNAYHNFKNYIEQK